MNVEHPGESHRVGGYSLKLYAREMGFDLLSDLIDPQSLPVELRREFIDRPWPKYDLNDKIVERCYMPPIEIEHSPDTWTLEILADNRICIDGVAKGLDKKSEMLRLFNIFCLCRDWRLALKDLVALGFGPWRDAHAQARLFSSTAQALRKKVAPHIIFGKTEPKWRSTYCFSPAMLIVDRREFNEPTDLIY